MDARLFVALKLGVELGRRAMGEVSAALAASRGLRSVRPEGLHLTLFFLGDVETERIDPLIAALEAALADAPAPRLVVEGTGAFPRRGRERVLWLGVREEETSAGRLAKLHALTLGAVEALGFDTAEERGRPFRPHLTVARPRGRSARVADAFYAVAPELRWRPGEVALVESVRRGPGPPFYEARRTFALSRDS